MASATFFLFSEASVEVLKQIQVLQAHFMYLIGHYFINDFVKLSGCRKWRGGE
jgi:hypothetical protein